MKNFVLESKGRVKGTTGQIMYEQYTSEDTLPDETAILYTAKKQVYHYLITNI